MKIKRLKIMHIKGIREVDIHARSTCNEIAGSNGAGKSSLLDSILFALAGKRAIQKQPISDGEKSGEIKIETDDLIITRKFNQLGTSLTVKSKDGGKFGQEKINNLLGYFTFDPLAFSRLTPREQSDKLKMFVDKKLLDKIEKTETKIDSLKNERLLLGREIKSHGEPVAVKKVASVSVNELFAARQKIEEHNNDIENLEHEMQSMQQEKEQACLILRNNQNRKNDLLEQLKEIEKEISEDKLRVDGIGDNIKNFKEIPERLSTQKIDEKIETADETNRKANAYIDCVNDKKVYNDMLERKEKLTDRIKSGIDYRDELTSEMQLPIDNCEFLDGGVVVNGIPFEQLSSSEKIKVSAEIGMSQNPELKIMFIRDGSLLDDDSFKTLVAVAEKKEYQLWVETVGDGHGDAIKLIDGRIENE